MISVVLRAGTSRPRFLLAPVAALFFACFSPQFAAAAHTPKVPSAIYVSPSGSDSNAGTISQPLRTLTHARDVVRKLLPKATGNVTVFLEEGTYRLAKPLRLTPEDSGRNGHQVIWAAAPGATPILSGGVRVSGWTEVDPETGIWAAPIPNGLRSRQIYVNGERAYLAEGPVPTVLKRTATGYTMATSDMSTWRNPSDIDFVYTQQLGQMVEPICPLAAISTTDITMAQPCWDNSNLRQIDSVTKWYDANLVGWSKLGLPTYVQNAYEVLTKPGQFYLDPTAHMLYYIPRIGQNMVTADVEVPVLQSLLQGVGTVANPIKNVTFRGIQFALATWMQPSTVQGFSEIQTGYTLTGNEAWATEGLCHLVKSGTCPYGAWTKEPGAVHFQWDHSISFINDRFYHLGAAGLDLGDGSQNDVVTDSVFTDISGNGIQLGSVDLNEAPLAEQTLNDQLVDNHIYEIGVEYHGAAAILFGYGAECTITHNQLDDLPYTAISAGWAGWLDKIGRSSLANYSHDNVISYNVIANYMETLSDGGGIYTQGLTGPNLAHGEKVIGNVIHDQVDWSFALHSDDGTGNVTYDGNVLYNDTYEWCCVHHNYSSGNGYYPQLFENNYWESGDPASSDAGIVKKDNHLITGPNDVPSTVFERAGIDPSTSSVLAWEPPAGQLPSSPYLVAPLYAVNDQVYLTWHPGLSGSNDPVDAYSISSCLSTDGTVAEPCADPGPTLSISAFEFESNGFAVLSGLTPGDEYWLTVTASNSKGLSTPSMPSALITAGGHAAVLPGAPRSITTRTAPGLVSLKWNAPASAACKGPWWAGTCANPITAYQITVSNGATYVASGLGQFIVSNGGGVSELVLALPPGHTYRFSIAAMTPAGTGPSTTTKWLPIPLSSSRRHKG